MSPLSEPSLSSPVEDTNGYQSEGSCGSGDNILGSRPRRGEVGYQDLRSHDLASPRCSTKVTSTAVRTPCRTPRTPVRVWTATRVKDQVREAALTLIKCQPFFVKGLLKSREHFWSVHNGIEIWMHPTHTSRLVLPLSPPDTRRSMPNLNKMRGGKASIPPPSNTAYGLSQRYTASDSRLQPPGPTRQAPRGLRPPQTSSGLVRPSYTSGLRPPGSVGGQQRKLSGIARPTQVRLDMREGGC